MIKQRTEKIKESLDIAIKNLDIAIKNKMLDDPSSKCTSAVGLRLNGIVFEITPLHPNTKPRWRRIFTKSEQLMPYLNWCGTNTTYGGMTKDGTYVYLNFPEILKKFRYGRGFYSRFQPCPKIKSHISSLKWRLNLFKRGFYDPKTINDILLASTGYSGYDDFREVNNQKKRIERGFLSFESH